MRLRDEFVIDDEAGFAASKEVVHRAGDREFPRRSFACYQILITYLDDDG